MKTNTILLSVVWLFFSSSVLFAQQPMTLEQCIEKARLHNRSLQNSLLEIQSSLEQKKEMSAKYLPEISANITAFQAFDKIIKADGTYPEELSSLTEVNPAFGQLAGQPYSFHELNSGYTATLSVMLPLYAGGQITTANKMASIGKDIAQLQYSLKEKEVIQKVTENYWQIANLKYNLQTIDAAEKQMEAVHQQVSNFVETGVTTRNALMKVKLREQELASNRLKLENATHILTMLLAQQIGMGKDSLTLDIPNIETALDLPEYIEGSIASLNREELKISEKILESNRLQIKMERGKNLPTLALGVLGYQTGIGGLSDGVKRSINTSMTNALGLVTLSIPISSWIGGSHAIKKAKIKLAQSQNDYSDACEQLSIDIESSWSNLIEAYKQIEIAKTSAEEAMENYRMASDQYTSGKETITELLDAETLKRQAENQLSSSIADYNIKHADYQRKIQ